MTKPESFIANSDFPTLKNDNQDDATVVIPASISIPGNGYLEYHTDLPIGIIGAVASARISSDKDSSIWYQAQTVVYTRIGVNGGISTPYNIAAFVWRPSANILRCQVQIPNPHPTMTTGAAVIETISFHVNTFLPPFS